LPDEFNQALEIRPLFLRVFRRADVVLLKDGDHLDSQTTILGIALGFFKCPLGWAVAGIAR